LWKCIHLVSSFPDREIVRTLCAELSWSHLRLLPAKEALQEKLHRSIELARQRLAAPGLEGGE
jgi:hypothetical protein